MNIVIVSAIISFLSMILINYLPKNTNQKVIFHLWKNCYHIHHWIIGLFLLGLIFLVKNINEDQFKILVGLIIGFVLEGFLFKDMFNILVKC